MCYLLLKVNHILSLSSNINQPMFWIYLWTVFILCVTVNFESEKIDSKDAFVEYLKILK